MVGKEQELLQYYDELFKSDIETSFTWRDDNDPMRSIGIDAENAVGRGDELVEELYILGEIYIHGTLSRRTYTKILTRRTKMSNLKLIEVIDKLDHLKEEMNEINATNTEKDRLLHGET